MQNVRLSGKGYMMKMEREKQVVRRHCSRYPFACAVIMSFVLPVVQSQNKELSYIIDEEGPVPSLVGNIARDSNVSALLGSDVFMTLRYRVLSQPDTNSELFSVGNTTGLLRTAARVDRESLCHFSPRCRLQVYVAMQQSAGPYFVTVKVNVYVRDINDNNPHFPQTSMAFTILENTATGVTIDITPAVDVDVGENTIQNYDLVTEDPTVFNLEVSQNLDGSLVPNLVVNSQLDREAKDFYSVTILAVDGGAQPRTGVLVLNVTVDDVNDNAPIFIPNQYNVTVNETLAPRSIIATVFAMDRDIGFNGEVRYGFSSRPLDDNANAFAINESSGQIISMQDLTDFQGQTLRLVVEATDRGSKPLRAQAIVNVNVIDAVNNPPIIRLTTISGGNTSLVKESSQTGYVVAHFIVSDTDSGTNGIVDCSTSRGDFTLQKLVENEFKITPVKQLDRESNDHYDVIVKCWDFGRPSTSSSVPFSVIIEDVNDNAPIFTRSVYQKNVTEEQGPGILLKVVATDRDIGENARVTYRMGNMTSFVSSLITVHANGDIVAKASFDRELYSIIDFVVLAEDHGDPKLTSTARVILYIIDINDRKPSLPSGYTLQVPENHPIDTVIGNIMAIDEDEGASGRVAYHLLSDDNATEYFAVTEEGQVRTRVTFDREAREYYQLSVLANDFGEPPNTNILGVTIRITDENDNPPRFLRPNDSLSTVNISTLTLSGSVIYRAKVEDADFGYNAQVEFSLIRDDYGKFTVNKTWGTVSTTRNLNHRDAGIYTLYLMAKDRGNEPRSSLVPLTVNVLAENVTMMASSQISDDHLIIVVVLVCVTAVTAACVTVILLRLRYSDRRERRLSCAASKTSSMHMREVRDSGACPGSGGGGCGRGGGDGVLEKSSWGGYDAVKGQGVEETGTQDMGRDSDDDLLLFKLRLAEQYKERDLYSSKSLSPSRHPLVKDVGDTASSDVSMCSTDVNSQQNVTRLAALKFQQNLLQRSQSQDSKNNCGKLTEHLEKPHADELLSSSSRETTGTDSGRGCSEDDSQAPESIRSETESGFSSFLAMPVKDGWRHVGSDDEKQASLITSKSGFDSTPTHSPGPSPYSTLNSKDPPQFPVRQIERSAGHSLNDIYLQKQEFSPSLDQNGSFTTFRAHTPRKHQRSVTFRQDNASKLSPKNAAFVENGKSREPRFQPQFQSSRARLNPASQQANSPSDYVNYGVKGDATKQLPGSLPSFYSKAPAGALSCYDTTSSDTQQYYINMPVFGTGLRENKRDSLNDSGDTADEENTTTTSGSYTIDQSDIAHELQSDIFV